MSLIDTDRALPEYQATRPATFHVLGADPDQARQAAKDEARLAGRDEERTMADDELRSLAREAINLEGWYGRAFLTAFIDDDDAQVIPDVDAAFIAAAKPPVILALLDRLAVLEAWVKKRKARDKVVRDRYRERNPDLHRKSARESMARTRAKRATVDEPKP